MTYVIFQADIFSYMTACKYSSKVSHVNTELNWNVTTAVELFTFDNLQKYSRNGSPNLF